MTAPVGPARPRRLRFEPILRLSLGLLFLLACAYIVLQFATLRSSLDSERAGQVAQSSAITQLSSALKTTQDQLAAHGITPKAPPPATIVQGVPGIPGQSVVGPAGPAGQNGASPDPAAIARMVLAMIHPSPGAVGAAGPAGPAGAPGKDSTVPGPPGAAGKDGKDGANGKDGQNGAPGATGPAPSGWTFTASDGTVYDCTPDTAGSTHYSCAARQSPPPPSPSPVPSQSATSPKQASPHRASAPVSTGPGRP